MKEKVCADGILHAAPAIAKKGLRQRGSAYLHCDNSR
jgi:hypothetical protein